MTEAILFLPDGFEEIEAITPLDILRRADIDVTSVSLIDDIDVLGSHGICVEADIMFDEIEYTKETMLILPGGPGVTHYRVHDKLISLLTKHNAAGGHIAAICAAPSFLGGLDMLKNKKATCHPSVETALGAKELRNENVVTDGNITTARAAGASTAFALELVRIIKGEDVAQEVAKAAYF